MKIILIIIVLLIIVYSLICLLVYSFQKYMVFTPQKGAVPPPEDLEIQELRLQTSDDESLHAWWMPTDDAKYTILFLHGNAGNISRGEKRMRLFRQMGCNALTIDYRGYGISSGSMKKEEDIYEDSRTAWQYIVKELGIPEEKIIIWGWSMGGAVAVNLARQKKCHALVMEATFYSLYDMAGFFYRFLPMSWLMRYHFTSGEKLPEITVPVLFAHSPADETVPHINGIRLYEKFSGTKKFIELTGDHNHGIFESQERFLPQAKHFLKL